MVGDCFLSSIDLFFVQTVEILYFHHNCWWLFPQWCWLVLCSDSGVLICFVIMVGDCCQLVLCSDIGVLSCFCHIGWWLFPQQHWLVLWSDSGDIVLLLYWLMTVSSAALTGSLFRHWSIIVLLPYWLVTVSSAALTCSLFRRWRSCRRQRSWRRARNWARSWARQLAKLLKPSASLGSRSARLPPTKQSLRSESASFFMAQQQGKSVSHTKKNNWDKNWFCAFPGTDYL